jgi:hypothetical protein
LKRLPGWRSRLDAAVEEIRRTSFDWSSQHDCFVGLVSKAVFALTGEDVATPYRGKYSTDLGALKTLHKAGFENLEALAASLLPEIPVSFARVGDIVTYQADDAFGCTFGVVNGERAFVLMPNGLGTMDILQARKAFKVG